MEDYFDENLPPIKDEFETVQIKQSEGVGRFMVSKKSFEKGDKIMEIAEPLLITLN